MSTSREKAQLVVVKASLEAVLGFSIVRVEHPQSDSPSPDFSAENAGLNHHLELKELIEPSSLSVRAAVLKHGSRDCPALSRRWSVVLNQETISTRIRPMPNFPDDPPESEESEWAEAGLRLVTRAEREAKHRASNNLSRRNEINVKGLMNILESRLPQLESQGIYATNQRSGLSHEQRHLLRGLPLALSHEPFPTSEGKFESPGIDIQLGWTEIRTGRADDVGNLIEVWLQSDEAENLRQSVVKGDVGHAILWLTGCAEEQSVVEDGSAFLPSEPIELPSEVDVVWAFIGPRVLRYEGQSGWSTYEVIRV